MNRYCDVYVYADFYGCWVCHIAAARPPEGAPDADMMLMFEDDMSITDASMDRYNRARKKREAWDKAHPPVPIAHDLAGHTEISPTPGDCANYLDMLRLNGFIVPDSAIAELRTEQGEMDLLSE